MPDLLRPRHAGESMYFPCIDDYFTEYNIQRKQALGQPFAPSLAGGGLAFLLEATRVAACMQIAAGCVISGTTDFYIVSHVDCGAYKYFAGVDWQEHSHDVQVASLWRDLHVAEATIREFLKSFNHPLDSSWVVPEVTFHLEVIDLGEQTVEKPNALTHALDFSHYRGLPMTVFTAAK